MPRDRSQQKQRALLKLKKPSWQKNSTIWKSSISICKTHYHQNMNTACLEIQWTRSWVKNLKPTTKETTKIIHKSITIKIDKTIKHLNQEHLYLTTIDNSNPKLNITRICGIEIAHSYNVTFVKVFIIWLTQDTRGYLLHTRGCAIPVTFQPSWQTEESSVWYLEHRRFRQWCHKNSSQQNLVQLLH